MNTFWLYALAQAMARQTMAYPFKVWGFGEGIALEALWQTSEASGERDYGNFVLGCFEDWLARGPHCAESDHSAPGGLLLDAYERVGDARYLALALRLAEHMHALPAGSNGARFHRPAHPDYHDYLYVDCMEVDAPFLCRLAQVTGDAGYYDRAAEQILGYSALLQDAATGLFYHQYNRATGAVNGSFWGRGNGWALLGLLKTLRLLPPDHIDASEIRVRFVTLADALAERQLETGDWPTVLDQPDTYREASLPAMFGYAFEVAIRAGLLPETFAAPAARAWDAMQERLTADGLLHGVSVATPPGDAAHYNHIPTGTGYPWGQGPALLWVVQRAQPED